MPAEKIFLEDPYLSELKARITSVSCDMVTLDRTVFYAASGGQEKRFWEIEGFAKVSCGGTHVKRTGEVGGMKLKRNNIGKGKERIEITLA